MKKNLLLPLCLTAAVSCMSLTLGAQTPVGSVSELTEGYYQIVYQGQSYTAASGLADDEEILGMYFTSYTEEFSATSTNRYYPLGLSTPIEGQIGRTFLRIAPSAETEGSFAIQTQNGHYLDLLAKASLKPIDLTFGDLEGGGLYILGYLPFEEDCWATTKQNGEFKCIVGKSGSNRQPLEVFPAPLDDYDVYQLSLVLPEAESHETTIEYSRVECTNENIVSLPQVYDGGFFVFPKDAEVSEEDFVCPQFDHLETFIEIEDGKVSVTYEEAVWFVDLTYHYYYKGREVGEESFHAPEGEPYPAPGSNTYTMPWGVSAAIPEGSVTEGVYDVDVELSVDAEALPFKYVENAYSLEDFEHWYHLVIGNASYVVYDPEIDHFELNITEIDIDKKANYRWAFVGNPVYGFGLINQAAGFDYVMTSNRYVDDGNTGGNTFLMMTEARKVGATDVWAFRAEASPYITEGSFYLGFTTDEGDNVYMNKRGTTLAYWTGGRDSGSTFYVEEVFAGAETLAEAIQAAEAAVESFRTTLDRPGYPSTEAVQALVDLIAEAKEVLADSSSTENDYYTLAYDLDRQISATRKDVSYPAAGKYYAFVNHQKNGDINTMYMAEEGLVGANNQTPAEVGDAAAFYCTPDTAEHTYQFYNPAFDRYLVWRGHRDGYNENKGYTTPEDAAQDAAGYVFTQIFLYPAGQYYEGAFLVYGKRGNGNDGTFIFMANGNFDAYSFNYGWTDNFSNMFTLEEVEYKGEGIIPTAVDVVVPSGAIYDLMGRRVVHPTSGIYIQDGRKMLIK